MSTLRYVAIAFGEPGAEAHTRRLNGFSRLLSFNLLEAEQRSVRTRGSAFSGEHRDTA